MDYQSVHEDLPFRPAPTRVKSASVLNQRHLPTDTAAPAKPKMAMANDRPFWRSFEVIASLMGMIAITPLILVLMAIVKMTSPGPALFAQQRVGRDGQIFVLFKLRSMFSGTFEVPTHDVPQDAFTPFGLFLRRWKLDELPQLYNVLIGDMSLVGPRPCLATQTELIEARWRNGLLQLSPGMTGLAQVQHIDMSDVERLMEVDARYFRTRTTIGDLKLILRTLVSI